MHGSLRIAVAELSLNENTNQSPGDQGFQERVVSGDTACICLARIPFLDAAELNSGSRGYSSVSSGKQTSKSGDLDGQMQSNLTGIATSRTRRTSSSTMARSSSTRTGSTMPTRTMARRPPSFRSLSHIA